MSAVLEKKPRARSSAATALSGTLPQVNLLPPEVHAARGLRKTKRWLAISLLLTVVVCVGAFGLALISSATAAAELVTVQDETARLQTEEAKYAEVPQVLGQLDQAETARTLGMSTEVLWKSYTDAIAAVLPPNVSIDTLTVTVATPMAPAAGPSDPLQGPSVGQVQFTGRSSTVPDTAGWVDALNAVPGLADAWVSAVTVTQDDSGIYYTVSATVQVTDAAYAQRFAAVEGES